MAHPTCRLHSVPVLALALALGVMAGMPVFAQDTGTDDVPTAPEGWTGTGELGFASARGNARSESLNLRFALGHEGPRWRHGWHASALRAKGDVVGDFDGDGVDEGRYAVNANRYELGLSSAYRLDGRNHVAGSVRYENDDFSPYEYQATLAISYGRQMIDSERTRLGGEIGPGYRRARDFETGVVESDLIVRGLLDFSHRLTDSAELVNRLLVEAGADNTFAQNDFGISVAMNESFALKAGLQARHNTEVGPDTRRTDTLTTINLVYSFR